MHPAVLIALGHLLMDNPTSCSHPLDIARSDRAMVSHAVAVLNRSGEDIGNSLDSSVWVPWKARQVVFRNVVAEIVEQQKRIEIGRVSETKCATKMHARSFQRRLGHDEPLNR